MIIYSFTILSINNNNKCILEEQKRKGNFNYNEKKLLELLENEKKLL